MKFKESDLEYLNKYIKENNLDDIYYKESIKKLESGLPIQYVIGSVNFFCNEIKVNKNFLINRF